MVKTLVAITVLTLMPKLVFALTGGSEGTGGGQSVVCKDASGKITSAELLDLYEVRTESGRQIATWPIGSDYLAIAQDVANELNRAETAGLAYQDQVVSGQNELDILHWGIMGGFANFNPTAFMKQVNFLPAGTGLKPIDDANSIVLPEHCQVLQAALYNDTTDKVQIVGDIWNSFDEINKAALLTHERLYRLLRIDGEKTSDHTRLAIGQVFSGYLVKSVLADISLTALYCLSEDVNGLGPDYAFAAYSQSSTKANVQWLVLDGMKMLNKTIASIDLNLSPVRDPNLSLRDTFFDAKVNSPMDFIGNISFEIKPVGKKKFDFFVGVPHSLQATDAKLVKVTCGPLFPRQD